MQLTETLRTLCALPAVSGFEEQAAQTVAELFRPYCDTVETDRNSNVLAYKKCGRKHAKTILLDAHLDQIGFIVTEVLDGGFVRFAPVGGVDPRMLLAGEVTILADEPLYGVVSCLPPHLLKAGEQDKAVPIDQMTIDTGLTDAKSRIKIGTPVVFAQQPVKLAGGQYCSKCLDDRAGVAAILLAMEKLKKAKKLKCDVAASFCPAPVEPVAAEMCTSLRSNPAAASGSSPSCRQVAKQPGFAMLHASRIFSRFISGRPYTNVRSPSTAPAARRKSWLRSITRTEAGTGVASRNIRASP